MNKPIVNYAKIILTAALFNVAIASNFNLPFLPSHIAIAQNNTKGEADRLRQEGERQIEAGQYVQGTQNLEKAIDIYLAIGDRKNAKTTLDRLILIYYSRGAFDKLEALEPILTQLDSEGGASQNEDRPTTPTRAENTSRELDERVEKLLLQGFTEQDRGADYAQARTYFQQALSQAKNIRRVPEQIAALMALGKSYLYERNYQQALVNLEAAERLSKTRYELTNRAAASGDINKMGDNFREIINYRIPTLLAIAETYLQQNNPNKALTYIQSASEISAKIDKDYQKFLLPYGFNYFEDPSLYLSRANYSLGKYDLALSHARKAIEKGSKLQKPTDAPPTYLVPSGDLGNGYGHSLAGMALEKLGKLGEAERELKLAVQIFETNRQKSTVQGNIKDNLKLFDNQVRAASILQRVLLAQNKPEEALAAAEWGRGRLLVESATAPKNLTVEQKVDALIDSQYANTPEDVRREIKKGYLEAARENPAILDIVTGTSPTNTAPSDIKPPSVNELKQIARSHRATIVEYSLISQTTFFHSSRQDTASWRIFPGEDLKLVIWVIKPTGEISSRQVDLKAKKINLKGLVGKTRETMGVGRNLGAFLKPGAKLPNAAARNISTGEFKKELKQLHKLLIEPIADLLPTNPEDKVVFVPQKELFLIPFVALIDSKDKYLIEKHTIITAPSIQALEVSRQKQQQIANSKVAVVVGNPTIFPALNLLDLPGAEQEGRAVAQKLNADLLTGDEATKARVLKELPKARYIHLAAHGLLTDYAGFGIPGAIVLAPDNGDDGLLTSSEIQELNLSAELAVLSACDTGRGDLTGDGVVGLSRAFIVAGVPSIIVTLWSIPDAPTAKLMEEFYRNFQDKKLDKAQALRQAMLQTITQYPEPMNWAAFTLVGQAGG